MAGCDEYYKRYYINILMLFVLHVKENTQTTVKIGQSDEGKPAGLFPHGKTVYNIY